MLGDIIVHTEMFEIHDLESIFQSVLAELGDGQPRDKVDPASISQVLNVVSQNMIHAATFSAEKYLKGAAEAPPWA